MGQTTEAVEPRHPAAGRVFPLSALMAECATFPDVGYDPGPYWECVLYSWSHTAMFASRLLEVRVPFGSVLRLVGLLADREDARDTELTVESVRPWTEVVVSDGHARYVLELLHDGAEQRCAAAGCAYTPLTGVVDRCRGHLAALDVVALAELASEHGADLRQTLDFEWSRIEGDFIASWLVEAGAVRGDAAAVIDAYVRAAFEDPDVIDEMYVSDAENRAVREAMSRERCRLTR